MLVQWLEEVQKLQKPSEEEMWMWWLYKKCDNKNEGVKRLRGGDFKYKLYWKGEETGCGGVGLMVKHDLVESVMEVRRVSPRIISIDIVVNEKVVNVVSVYAPQSGRSEKEKEKFYEDLTAEVQSRHGICFV